MDNFSGQTTPSVLEKVEEQGVIAVMVPAGMTDRLQPLDVSTNKAAKDFLREKFRQWYAKEVESSFSRYRSGDSEDQHGHARDERSRGQVADSTI